jgi:acyl dehydratase
MPSPKYFEELEEGTTYECGGRTLSAADLNSYISLSGNTGGAHVNKVVAQEAGFDERVVHGLAIVAIQQGMALDIFKRNGGGLYGYDKIRFIQPVYVGDTLNLKVTIEELEDYDEQNGLVTFKREMFKHGADDPAFFAISKHLAAKKNPGDDS